MSTKIKIGVAIINNNNILLIKEKIKKKKTPLWNIVTGTYGDNGDEDIFKAAQRECMEEVCVSVRLMGALGCYISKDKDEIRAQFNFLAKITDGKPMIPNITEQAERNESISEVRWFAKNEILKMKSNEFISNRIHTLILNWISNDNYPIEIYKQIDM